MFFCQCCPAWYPGQSLIPDEELDTDVGMQQPALHNTTYAKCRVNAEATVQEMIYWWGLKENHINLIVCYLEVIILRVVASSLDRKRLFSSFGIFSLCWAIICEMKSKKAPTLYYELDNGGEDWSVSLPSMYYLMRCVDLVEILFQIICTPHVLKTSSMNACFINFICLCSKSNTQDPYNCCLT